MRTLKFRGKRLDNQEWEQGNYVAYKEDDGESMHCIVSRERNQIGASLDFVPVNPHTVGQFTGLFDKNGKEIFEGDIAVVKSSLNNKEYILPLIYKDGCFVLWSDEQNQGIVLHKLSLDRIEIIGNIHDNPELLNPDSE